MTIERCSEQGDGALTLLDELVAAALAWAAPLRFDIARTPAEREAVFRLRYEAVMARGWARPEDFPDRLERDAYDEEAVLVLGWDGGRPVAANRLVFPRSGRPLPTESAFALTIAPRGQVADWTRTLVVRGISDGTHRAFAGLLARSWQATRAAGYDVVCGTFSAPAIRLYGMLGIQVEVLGAARRAWGEERYPVRLDVPPSVPALAAWLARVGADVGDVAHRVPVARGSGRPAKNFEEPTTVMPIPRGGTIQQTPQHPGTITRHAEATAALRNSNTSLSAAETGRYFRRLICREADPLPAGGRAADLIGEMRALILVYTDGHRHERLKELIRTTLSARVAGSAAGIIAETVHQLLDEVAPRGRMDIVRDFAGPLPAI